ncbi:EsaB/YukD family protein [Streptomyces sp. NBC_00322]|uniref:hypothetical protein n=1 Tax=Streptomyces sp. NBC_00322 TaxID=2975712 RepID=UPI002E2E36B0|nr:hypothetical protein [Streptomyces sp. NBC_00322]
MIAGRVRGSLLTPGDSLADAGIVDGATLYLRDQRDGEWSELTVTDLDEQITAAREHSGLWSARPHAQAVLGAGLLVTVSATGWLGAHRSGRSGHVALRARRAGLGAARLGTRPVRTGRCQAGSASFWR